jgi:DNA-binding phage protein
LQKRAVLLKALGSVVQEARMSKNKGILLLSYEYDLPNNSLERIEKGMRDPQITTIRKIVNALGMRRIYLYG